MRCLRSVHCVRGKRQLETLARGFVFALIACCAIPLVAATPLIAATAKSSMPPPVTMTAEQDHQQMMDQLGIKALRPGVQNDVKAKENPVNYDEAKANPWPNYPDPLTFENGSKVTTADEWNTKRRPELVELFEREIYGREPANLPKVTWTVQTVRPRIYGLHADHCHQAYGAHG